MPSEATSDHSGGAPGGPQIAAEDVSAGQTAVPSALTRLAALIATSPHNLVSAGERAAVLERHVLEGLSVANQLTPTGRWMDLGTGAGLPGLVLAWRHRDVAWTLVDATAKKVAAVQAFAGELALANVTAVQARAEALAWEREHRGAYNGVVARALAPMVTLVELARGFVAAGGTLVAVKGPRWREELEEARGALRTLRFSHVSTERLDSAGRETWLVTMRAAGPPPPGYPRRDGVPKADPLR